MHNQHSLMEARMMTSNMSECSAARDVDRFGFMGGNQYTSNDSSVSLVGALTPEKLRKRESKWLEMLQKWDFWMGKRFPKIRARCRKGIPPAMRARAWQFLCGSPQLMYSNKDLYDIFLMRQCDHEVAYQIEKDISRQFPHHELFCVPGGQGQQSLFNVLKAYSLYAENTGYCQGYAPLVATLLMHMSEPEAFWVFVAICKHYMQGYYDVGLDKVQVDGLILYGLLKTVCPAAYKHLIHLKIEPVYFMVDWFMCLFTRNLPWSSILKVLDMFFCEGIKVLFRVALVILSSLFGNRENQLRYSSLDEAIMILRHLPEHITREEYLIKESVKLSSTVTSRAVECEHEKQLKEYLSHNNPL